MLEFKAAVTKSKGAPFELQKIKLKSLKDNEVLVKIKAAGMCHTDMVARDQDYEVPLPVVLGHEGSGVVEQVGKSVKGIEVGDHVVLSFASCGQCKSCLKAEPVYCYNFYPMNFGGSDENGFTSLSDQEDKDIHDHFFGQSSFAEYAIATERNTVVVPKDVPLEILGPLGCGIQTGAGAIMNGLKIENGSSVAIFGAGAVGLAAVMAAKIMGASQIIAVDIVDSRLELAKELGATDVINSKSADVVETIMKITESGADYSLEATGRPEILRWAIDSLAIRGTCGFVGAPALGVEASFDVNGVMVPGKTIKGIIEGESIPQIFIPQLVEHYRAGRFPFDKLIKFYHFEQINEAAKDSEKGITVKPIIQIS
ncbi:MAG TPA: NAD(P)-dependent alcohol dehydrogenase [Bacteriovoracaceae bacterium]|nr:NAD(P)-dependent alcohol dehydrogenase [Bacteriovoracaceae bacterium]